MALATIGAAKGQNAYRRATIFRSRRIPASKRQGGQGPAALCLHIAPTRPDEQRSHRAHNGQNAQARHYLQHIFLHSPPVEAAFIAHSWRHAKASQMIIDKAARAETNG